MRGVVRAFEGTGSSWNKFRKVGETKRFYVFDMLVPVPSLTSSEVSHAGAGGMQKPVLQEESVMSLSLIPEGQNPIDAQAGAWSKNIL